MLEGAAEGGRGDRSAPGQGPGDHGTEPDLERDRHGGRHSCRGDRKHAPLGVSAAAARLVKVGDIGPDTVETGVEQEGVEIREPESTTKEGGEKAQGAKPTNGRSDHVRTVEKSTLFV